MTELAIHIQGLEKRFGERTALAAPGRRPLEGLRDRVQAVILAYESGLVTVRGR